MPTPDADRLHRDLELMRHLALFELGLVVESEVDPPAFAASASAELPWRTGWLLLRRVVEAVPVAEGLARHLNLERPVSLGAAVESDVLTKAIDAQISEFMTAPVALDLGITVEDARQRIVQLSRDIGLLPPLVVDVVDSFIPWARRQPLGKLAQLVDDPGLIDRVRRENLTTTMHFDRVRKRGLNAELQLIAEHRPLVARIARCYVGRSVAHPELIEAGNRGLVSAVANFDHRKGDRFRSYAAWWIRQAITSVVTDAEGSARVPAQLVHITIELMRSHRRLLRDLGREPTTEELADAMGLTVEQIEEFQSVESDIGGPSDLSRLEDIVRMDMAFDAPC